MQQQFTKEFMENNCGCYSQKKLHALSFMQSESITFKSIMDSKIPLKDKYWFLCKKLATKDQNKKIAITVAEIVLPIYEKRYPKNKAAREAIEAARSYIAGHISLEELRTKRYAAAAAAAAAAADAYAAAAADAAAYAAADADAAADAYAAAAADAAAAYAAADIKQQLQNYLLTFIEQ